MGASVSSRVQMVVRALVGIRVQMTSVHPIAADAMHAVDVVRHRSLRALLKQAYAVNAITTPPAPSANFAIRVQIPVRVASPVNAVMIRSVRAVVVDRFVCKGIAWNVLMTPIAVLEPVATQIHFSARVRPVRA